MTKVLHLSPSVRLLGARQSLLTLVTHLDRERYEPLVAVPFRQGGLPEALDEIAVKHHTVRMGQWRKVKFWWRIPIDVNALTRIARREKIGLIHCNEPHVIPYALKVAEKLRLPVVSHLRLDNVDQKLVTNYSLAKVDHTIAVSEAVAAQMDPFVENRTERVTVVPNGVDAEAMLARALKREEARKRFGLKPGDLLLAQVGLISPRKQCHIAIEAFSKIAWKFGSARLYFVGNPGKSDGAYAKALQADIERRGLLDRVMLLPFRRDIETLYAALDLNMLVSEQEGFGRVLIEAGAFGVPSIASTAGGIPEVVTDGESGLLVPPGDPAAIAKALEAALSSEPYRAQLGEAMRQKVMDRFSGEAHAQMVMDVFDKVLAAKPKRRSAASSETNA